MQARNVALAGVLQFVQSVASSKGDPTKQEFASNPMKYVYEAQGSGSGSGPQPIPGADIGPQIPGRSGPAIKPTVRMVWPPVQAVLIGFVQTPKKRTR
jgi:hypothetical protein